jgi:hypothetical protein
MNAPVHIGADVFDAERQAFLRAVRAFLADLTVPAHLRVGEVESTIRALQQLVTLGADNAG